MYYRYLANTDKARYNELNYKRYTIICGTKDVKVTPALYNQIGLLLNTKILKLNRINYYSKGYVKLIARVENTPSWLNNE